MDIFSRIYYALAECCTGVKMKERRPQLEAVLDDLKRLNKDEFKFVIKQYLVVLFRFRPPLLFALMTLVAYFPISYVISS